MHSPQHQESFAKNCDICNAKTVRAQGTTLKSASSNQTKNLTNKTTTVVTNNQRVDEDSIFISNNSSTSHQITLSSSKSLDSGEKGRQISDK